MRGWFIRLLVLQTLAVPVVRADVIYLTDGNVLLVEKAWEEGDEVKYQTSNGIQSLPKSRVRSIQQQKPVPSPGGGKWVRVPSGNQKEQTPSPPTVAPSSSVEVTGKAVSSETLARLRDNLRTDPSDAMAKAELVRALNSVATLQVAQGDLVSARGTLEEALDLDRTNVAILSNLATVFFRQGNYEKAEGLLRARLAIDRKDQRTYLFLGEAYYEQEKIGQAISIWKEGLQLGPNEAIAARLERARREYGVHNELGEIKSSHFILRYDTTSSHSQIGDQILATLEEQYRRFGSELTSQAPQTISVILYPDRAYFDITRAPGWSGGVYDGKIRIPIKGLYSVTADLQATLAHELTHSFMAALPGRGSPTWFLEGVAQVQEGKTAANDRKALARLQQSGDLIPLQKLRGSFINMPAGIADVAYAESLSAVDYMIARFGRSSIRNILDLMARNYNFENAFTTALQRSVSDFETAWQRDLTQ
jgi:tetratricopeptide (TPR) repeat protein